MQKHRAFEPACPPLKSAHRLAGNLRLNCLILLAALCLLAGTHAQATEAAPDPAKQTLSDAPQVPDTATASNIPPDEEAAYNPPDTQAAVTTSAHPSPPVESELIVEGLASYGNYRIFASGRDCKLYTAGVEYDRHSWDYFLKARVDYVAEVLPLVLLNEATQSWPWGAPATAARETVPGFAISPIGFRMLWRNRKAIEPYLSAKGGLIAFPKKVLATDATYVNFSLQSGFGVQARLTSRLGLRLGLWNDFHFSNAFMVPVNPGIDMMNANLGLSFHFGQ